ncbi:MAG: hypothetical protein K2X27_23385 [Candidatus Obscuribacterales bacterium]|nr:hypothetical protein [Candidatus Obscuribacterales bacterium]
MGIILNGECRVCGNEQNIHRGGGFVSIVMNCTQCGKNYWIEYVQSLKESCTCGRQFPKSQANRSGIDLPEARKFTAEQLGQEFIVPSQPIYPTDNQSNLPSEMEEAEEPIKCDQCGRERTVESRLPDPMPICQCKGALSSDAEECCKKCGKIDWKYTDQQACWD